MSDPLSVPFTGEEVAALAGSSRDPSFVEVCRLFATIVALQKQTLELRRLINPVDRPSTVADYLAPIVAHLELRSAVEDDGISENDEARTLCWLSDALAADGSEQLRRSEELLKTGAVKAGDAVVQLQRRNDELLDQLSLVLPEKLEAYIDALPWSTKATDEEKTLVAGNLRSFALTVRSISPIPTEEEAGQNP